jgi:hypothetical protein
MGKLWPTISSANRYYDQPVINGHQIEYTQKINEKKIICYAREQNNRMKSFLTVVGIIK